MKEFGGYCTMPIPKISKRFISTLNSKDYNLKFLNSLMLDIKVLITTYYLLVRVSNITIGLVKLTIWFSVPEKDVTKKLVGTGIMHLLLKLSQKMNS